MKRYRYERKNGNTGTVFARDAEEARDKAEILHPQIKSPVVYVECLDRKVVMKS